MDAWLPDLLKHTHSEPSRAIYDYLSPTNKSRLESRLNRLLTLKALKFKGRDAKVKRGKASHIMGRQFEHLIHGLLKDCKALRYVRNVRTGTAEIDFLIGVEPLGFRFVPMLSESGNHLVGEAKCYTTAPKSEWVSEFSGILKTHNARTGILFVSCVPRVLAPEIRANIALLAAGGQRVVPFGLAQLEEIRRGRSFLEVLVSQYTLAAVHSTALSV